jgi:glucosyl-dolichyl phosphate glucuronosyltransferase
VALRPVGTNTLKQRNAMGTRGTVLSADLKDMKAPDGTGVFVTVLICTRDRAETLERTLESLLCPANLKVERWDIVVVDNGSRDHTAHVCQAFRERFPDHFSFCIEKRPGKSNALNTGVAVAKGDVIAFTDDDVTCAPDYLQAIRTVFNQYPVDAVQGRIVLECEGGHPVWLDRLLGLTVGWREDATEFTDLQGTLCGSNMVVKAEVLRRVGAFLPGLGPGAIGLGEETELTLRMRNAGYRLGFAPQILAWHHLPKKRLTRSFIRRRFFQQGRAHAYYEPLPVPLYRFALYVVKETILEELAAIWHRAAGRPVQALRCQAGARSQAGFFWQHYLFTRAPSSQTPANSVGVSGTQRSALEDERVRDRN